MRRFNPEKELYKIQHGNRNKILYGVIVLLLIISIGSTYALYQVRYSKRIIYTKVSPFYNKDIQLAVYVDGIKQDNFPTQDEGKIYTGIECDKEYSEAYFDNKEWKLHLTSDGPNKCKVKFETGNLPNPPELYQGMIPVIYGKNGIMYVADTNSDWYNYQDHRWGNAVLVDASNETIKNKYFKEDNSLREDIVGKEVPMEEVLQMYVWIPRYKYQLFNVGNIGIAPQEIKIQFEKGVTSTGNVTCNISSTGVETCQNDINGNWYTHPAFTFGDSELPGIWIGKFESSGSDTNTKIIPNVEPIISQNISYMFNASRNIEETHSTNFNLKKEEIDTHLMKNMEWGAMAYLTHSKYGRCISDKCEEVSKTLEGTTGYSSGRWDTTNGELSSTTKNMYGIYDTNGGKWEYVMGTMVDANGAFNLINTGFSVIPNSKYYELYEYNSSSLQSHERGHLGDATREILSTFGHSFGGWYNDIANMPAGTSHWFIRGGRGGDNSGAGTYAFGAHSGPASIWDSFRVVITEQDGNE